MTVFLNENQNFLNCLFCNKFYPWSYKINRRIWPPFSLWVILLNKIYVVKFTYLSTRYTLPSPNWLLYEWPLIPKGTQEMSLTKFFYWNPPIRLYLYVSLCFDLIISHPPSLAKGRHITISKKHFVIKNTMSGYYVPP